MTGIFISLTILSIGMMFLYKFKRVINENSIDKVEKNEESEDFVYV